VLVSLAASVAAWAAVASKSNSPEKSSKVGKPHEWAFVSVLENMTVSEVDVGGDGTVWAVTGEFDEPVVHRFRAGIWSSYTPADCVMEPIAGRLLSAGDGATAWIACNAQGYPPSTSMGGAGPDSPVRTRRRPSCGRSPGQTAKYGR
jgi:hypothetical protein